MSLIQRAAAWFGLGGILSDHDGQQITTPSGSVVQPVGADGALQISTVYACANILAGTVSSLPLMVYRDEAGKRTLARGSQTFMVLHRQPNDVMTAAEFWETMVMFLALRGNAYAQIFRDDSGEVTALWPLAPDQMTVYLRDGELVYSYRKGTKTTEFRQEDILHLKGLGTGVVGFSKLEFMTAGVNEAAETQRFAVANSKNFGKPSGVLTVDHIIKDTAARQNIQNTLWDFKTGGAAKLAVLEADMKFQQVSLTPEQSQLLETRRYGVEEICRWFGVPPVLIGASGATTWGSGISEIVSGFHKFTINPLINKIEQALEARVLRPEERGRMTCEFSMDGLLRGDIKARYESYSIAVQNGFKTRNEVRQLENDPPIEGADKLTAQTSLAPLDMLGKTKQQTSQKEISEIRQ